MKANLQITEVESGVFATIGARYNKRYQADTLRQFPHIVAIIEWLRDRMDISADEIVPVMKPFRRKKNGARTLGCVIHGSPRVFIDPRQSLNEIADTVAHEFQHVLQIRDGDLVPTEGGRMWKGAFVACPKNMNRMAYKRYRALPWEAEAFEVGERLGKECLDALYGVDGLDRFEDDGGPAVD